MKRTLVLGAGFSCAISSHMPMTDRLGQLVLDRLKSPAGTVAPTSFSGTQFEAWLSRLAEPQPYLDHEQNLANRSLFLRILTELRETLIERQLCVLAGEPDWWLQKLVGVLHYSRTTVVTFNYDMLVECTVDAAALRDSAGHRVRSDDIVRNMPPLAEAPPSGLVFPSGRADSFRYLKLHGSVDAFWVPGDDSGATIGRWNSGAGWGRPVKPSDGQRREVLPGREPYIVPPAAAKSAFYGNPLARELWHSAAAALAESDDVALIGYSIPVTDLVTSGMLRDTIGGNHAKVTVVNLDAAPVVERLEELGIDKTRVATVSGRSACEAYVDQLEHALRPGINLGQGVDDVPLAVGRGNAELQVLELLEMSPDGVATLQVGPAYSGPQDCCAPFGRGVTLNDLHAACSKVNRIQLVFPDRHRAAVACTDPGPGPSGAPECLLLKPTAFPPAS